MLGMLLKTNLFCFSMFFVISLQISNNLYLTGVYSGPWTLNSTSENTLSAFISTNISPNTISHPIYFPQLVTNNSLSIGLSGYNNIYNSSLSGFSITLGFIND